MKSKKITKQLIVRIVVAIALLGLLKIYLIFLHPVGDEKFSIYVRPTTTYADVKEQMSQHANLSSRFFFGVFSTVLGLENKLHEIGRAHV